MSDIPFSQLNEDLEIAISALAAAFEKISKSMEQAAQQLDEVVEYILNQPKHTWMGVTIYPDEAWRYRCKSDWMWWRE